MIDNVRRMPGRACWPPRSDGNDNDNNDNIRMIMIK